MYFHMKKHMNQYVFQTQNIVLLQNVEEETWKIRKRDCMYVCVHCMSPIKAQQKFVPFSKL